MLDVDVDVGRGDVYVFWRRKVCVFAGISV